MCQVLLCLQWSSVYIELASIKSKNPKSQACSPQHQPAVVWMFRTAIFLPSGPSTSTISAPLWIALHSNHACLAKEKCSFLPTMVKVNQLITQATSISWNCLFTIKGSKSLKWDIWRTHQGQQQQRLLANLAWILTADMQLAKGIVNFNHSKSSNYMQWWTQTQTISKRSHQLNPSPMASTS